MERQAKQRRRPRTSDAVIALALVTVIALAGFIAYASVTVTSEQTDTQQTAQDPGDNTDFALFVDDVTSRDGKTTVAWHAINSSSAKWTDEVEIVLADDYTTAASTIALDVEAGFEQAGACIVDIAHAKSLQVTGGGFCVAFSEPASSLAPTE